MKRQCVATIRRLTEPLDENEMLMISQEKDSESEILYYSCGIEGTQFTVEAID